MSSNGNAEDPANIDLNAGETVTCTFTNSKPTATRTQGFWSTHLALATTTWLAILPAQRNFCGGAKDMGNDPTSGSNDVGEMMGGFWSNIPYMSGGRAFPRSPFDQSRMQLVQQLLAAILNRQAFGTDDGGKISAGIAAYCGVNQAAILGAAGALGAYNQSGDSVPLGFAPRSATPQAAQGLALRSFWDILP